MHEVIQRDPTQFIFFWPISKLKRIKHYLSSTRLNINRIFVLYLKHS